MRCWILAVSIALLALAPTLASPALAGPQLEISLLGGGTFGGSQTGEDASGEFETAWNAGGMIGLRPRPDDRQVFFISYQYQSAELALDIWNRPPQTLPIHVGVLHGGIEVDGKLFSRLHPFMNVSLGATHYTPDIEGTETTWFFSTGIRGGFKVPITSWLGLRLQGGFLATVVPDGKDILCLDDGVACITAQDTFGLYQGEATGGLYLRF